jgi:hypothetical protein
VTGKGFTESGAGRQHVDRAKWQAGKRRIGQGTLALIACDH